MPGTWRWIMNGMTLMPAPTIEAMPVAVRPTSPMLRTNLALAKAGAGPEHRRMPSARTHLLLLLRLVAAPAVPPRPRSPSPWSASSLAARPCSGPRPAPRPGRPDGKLLAFLWNDHATARATGLGGGPRRDPAAPADGAAQPGRGLRAGLASRPRLGTSKPARCGAFRGRRTRRRCSRRRPVIVRCALGRHPTARTAAWVQDGDLWRLRSAVAHRCRRPTSR